MTARILLLDIETFPNLGYTWGMYEQNVIAIKEHWKLACFSAMWLHQEGIRTTVALPDVRNEKALVRRLGALLDTADVVIAHNGDQFDLPKINTRLIVHGIAPPSPYKTVDTKTVAKRVFGFTSNKLDDLCQQLGIGKKINTEGFELWQQCMANDPAAWDRMRAYNEHDVTLLHGLYTRLLPWINTHPNVAIAAHACPKCGSSQLQSRGYAKTKTRTYSRYQCQGCGGWSRSTRAVQSASITNL